MKKLFYFVCVTLLSLGITGAYAQKGGGGGFCTPTALTLTFTSQSLSGVNCPYTISVSPMITNCDGSQQQMMVPQNQVINMGGTVTFNFVAPSGKKFVPGKYVIGLTPSSGGCSMSADYVASSSPTTTWACSCGTDQGLHCTTWLIKNTDYDFKIQYGCTVGM